MKKFYQKHETIIVSTFLGIVTLFFGGLFTYYFNTGKEESPKITTTQGNQSVNNNGNGNVTTYNNTVIGDTTKKETKRERRPVYKQINTNNSPINISQQNTGGTNSQTVNLNQ